MINKKADVMPFTDAKQRKKIKREPLATLKEAVCMATDALYATLSDARQFNRHVYTEKGSGELVETTLETCNLKQLREAINAIRELGDATRSLYGILTPQEQLALDRENAKLRAAAQDAENETGVILLPMTEEASECEM